MIDFENNKGFIITIIVLLVISLGLGGFIVYDKFLTREEVEESIVNIDDASIDLNAFYNIEDIINKFDVAFNDNHSTFYAYPYKLNKLEASNFDMGTAIYVSSYDKLLDNGALNYLREGDVKASFSNIFGKNLNYTATNVVAGENFNITFNESKYDYIMPNIDKNKLFNYELINTKTTVLEDKVIVTRKLFYAEFISNDQGLTITQADIYADDSKSKKLTSITLRNGSLNKKEIIGKVGSKLNTYEYTFNRNKDNDYNFYSIVRIK